MPKSKQARKAEKATRQPSQGISWKTVISILFSIATAVSLIVGGLDFINYLREGYQQFLWLGIAVLGIVWLIILWLLFKQRNIYGILWLAVTILAGAAIWSGWRSYIQAREEKLIVVIATFDGPEEVYGMRNEMYEKLDQDFKNDSNIVIKTVNEIITPDSDSGSPRAVKLGKSLQADVVIWGWYRPTENPNIHIHLENMSHDFLTPLKDSSAFEPQSSLAELESFSFQQQFGGEVSELILFLDGFIQYKAGNYSDAILRFDKAITNYEGKPEIVSDRVQIFLYRANSNLHLNKFELAINDYTMAIQIAPQTIGA
jgi:hypothetical protein